MKFNKKFILFTLIGVASILPIQAQARDLLLDIATQVGQQVLEEQKGRLQDRAQEKLKPYINTEILQSNVKTPGLCPQHYPLGAPIVVSLDKEKIERRSFYLCHEDYAVQYDAGTKNPIWVAEKVVGAKQIEENVERVDNFQPNPQVPYGAQATLNDYRGSGFDRGHNAPAANMTSVQAMEESFYLTNMIPQVGPNMNRGIWAELEGMVRKWSIARGEVLVVTGPIFGKDTQAMGKSKVLVPTHIYKVVLDPYTKESLAFVMPNKQIITRKTRTIDDGNPNFPQTTAQQAVNCGRVCTIDDFIVSLAQLEAYTNLRFFSNMRPQEKQYAMQKGRMWHAR